MLTLYENNDDYSNRCDSMNIAKNECNHSLLAKYVDKASQMQYDKDYSSPMSHCCQYTNPSNILTIVLPFQHSTHITSPINEIQACQLEYLKEGRESTQKLIVSFKTIKMNFYIYLTETLHIQSSFGPTVSDLRQAPGL